MDPSTSKIHDPKVELSAAMSLLGRSSVPIHGYCIILGDSSTLFMHDPEGALRKGVSVVGREPAPFHCFDIILRDSPAP